MEVPGVPLVRLCETYYILAGLVVRFARVASDHKNVLINWLTSLKNELSLLEKARLQGLQDIDHKAWVAVVIPVEEAGDACLVVLHVVRFLEHKVHLERLKEVDK